MYLIDPSEPADRANSENGRLGWKRRGIPNKYEIRKWQMFWQGKWDRHPLVELPRRPLKVASILIFLSPNVRISEKSAKPFAQRGKKFRRPPKPAKSTVFEILSETNMNSKSTKNGISLNQIHPNLT